jgi:hypothetical protein
MIDAWRECEWNAGTRGFVDRALQAQVLVIGRAWA